MKPWVILLNNFCHDLFTGLWFGSFVVLFVLRQQGAPATEGAPLTWFIDLTGLFWTFLWVSLVLILITGETRFLLDRRGDGGIAADNWELKKKMLIVKHAFLGVSLAAGSVLGYLWTH